LGNEYVMFADKSRMVRALFVVFNTVEDFTKKGGIIRLEAKKVPDKERFEILISNNKDNVEE
ncbi:MAG: hypothetical protein GWN56_09800, partial [Nitrosopumilaceae archaeon]|nr:hypothetical protein [Nitrosopumilaceae archaeon]NIV66019.1 hypothetical protein [Nitrosopumilaceae archaeon]